MPKFIKYYDGALDDRVCLQMIERFEQDLAQEAEGPSNAQVSELVLPEDTWNDAIGVLQASLSTFLGRYQSDVKFLAGSAHKDLHAEPLRMNRFDPGVQLSWQTDDNTAQNQTRCLAAHWCLSTVDKGGNLEFEEQATRIKPVAGRLTLFPVNWTYRRRETAARSGPKYVCTTFVHRIF